MILWGLLTIAWAAPTVSYLWPTRTELSRQVSENRIFPGRNISGSCPGQVVSCSITEIQITSCPSKKGLFTSHFCDLYRGLCRVTEIISEAPFFVFLIFSDFFLIAEAGAKTRPGKEESLTNGGLSPPIFRENRGEILPWKSGLFGANSLRAVRAISLSRAKNSLPIVPRQFLSLSYPP